MAVPARRHGTVTEFDADVGLGVITTADDARFPFHCTRIADGSRHIDVGAAVTFEVRPAVPGRWEAFDVDGPPRMPLPPPPSPR